MRTSSTDGIANPYIGPRSFVQGERLYGRAHELHELLYLLIAERIVLLYSPSGAGKTSLIQATLVPALAQKKFHVLPLIRVNREDVALPRRHAPVRSSSRPGSDCYSRQHVA
jgi:chromosomal replication initiation ATPase DnaA